MDEQTARIEIHLFITERWSELWNELTEKGYDSEEVFNENLDTLIDDILIN